MFGKVDKPKKLEDHQWIRNHKRVDSRHHYYVTEDDVGGPGNNIYWNDLGDGVHCFDVVKYKESHHARHMAQLLNVVLSDDKIFKLVAEKMDNKEWYIEPPAPKPTKYVEHAHNHKCSDPKCKGYDPEYSEYD